MLDVAVVILNWNGLFLLQKFIPILLKYNSYGYHIYIVDNGSTDDSIDWICDNYSDEIQVVALSENFGFAKGYNEGLKQIDADYYILLNSDVAVSENWCEPLINFLQNNHDYAVVLSLIHIFST